MAGSYGHIVNEEGQLLELTEFVEKTDCDSGMYGVVEEMYGMIWFLASFVKNLQSDRLVNVPTIEEIVENAQKAYKIGIERSPGIAD